MPSALAACLTRGADVCELIYCCAGLHHPARGRAEQEAERVLFLINISAEVAMTIMYSGLRGRVRPQPARGRESLRAGAACDCEPRAIASGVRLRAACDLEPRAIASRMRAAYSRRGDACPLTARTLLSARSCPDRLHTSVVACTRPALARTRY